MSHPTLSARQEDRCPLTLRAEFEIAPAHREQIRYSPSSSAPQSYVAAGRSIDISAAGLGLACEQFVPRMTEGVVRLFAKAGDGSGERLVFEHSVKVRRVSLRIADKPSYMLGTAFLNPSPTVESQVNELVRRLGPAVGPAANREAHHA